jgi:hypothetical protein
MDGMKLIDHWMFARTDRQTDGQPGDYMLLGSINIESLKNAENSNNEYIVGSV